MKARYRSVTDVSSHDAAASASAARSSCPPPPDHANVSLGSCSPLLSLCSRRREGTAGRLTLSTTFSCGLTMSDRPAAPPDWRKAVPRQLRSAHGRARVRDSGQGEPLAEGFWVTTPVWVWTPGPHSAEQGDQSLGQETAQLAGTAHQKTEGHKYE